MPEVDPTVRLRMVSRLLDQLQEDLVDETVLAHRLVQNCLDEHHVAVIFVLKNKIVQTYSKFYPKAYQVLVSHLPRGCRLRP